MAGEGDYLDGKESKGIIKLAERTPRNYLFYLIIFLIIALGVYLLFYIRTESFKCISNPLVYGAGNLKAPEGKEVSCSCSMPGSQQLLLFNKHNSTVVYSITQYDTDFSKISANLSE